MALEFKNLTLENLASYEQEILASEQLFHENLREDSESIRETAECRGYIGFVALLGGKYIGNIQGFCPTQEDIDEMELLGVKEDPEAIYIGNFVINPEHQGRGYGSQLLTEMIRSARDARFRRLEGHFRNGASVHIVKKAGAEEIETHDDWFKTGEPYTHCRIAL